MADPVKVSPLIKFARWSLLIAGIFYGASKQKVLAAREVHIRREEERLKEIRHAKLLEEKRIASDKDIEMISRLVGYTAPPAKPAGSSGKPSASSSSKPPGDDQC